MRGTNFSPGSFLIILVLAKAIRLTSLLSCLVKVMGFSAALALAILAERSLVALAVLTVLTVFALEAAETLVILALTVLAVLAVFHMSVDRTSATQVTM